MISNEEAKNIANNELFLLGKKIGDKLQLVESETIEESFGWVFFYNSQKYLETGELTFMLAGNSPFIVDKERGEIHYTGTEYPIEHYIKEFRYNLNTDRSI